MSTSAFSNCICPLSSILVGSNGGNDLTSREFWRRKLTGVMPRSRTNRRCLRGHSHVGDDLIRDIAAGPPTALEAELQLWRIIGYRDLATLAVATERPQHTGHPNVGRTRDQEAAVSENPRRPGIPFILPGQRTITLAEPSRRLARVVSTTFAAGCQPPAAEARGNSSERCECTDDPRGYLLRTPRKSAPTSVVTQTAASEK